MTLAGDGARQCASASFACQQSAFDRPGYFALPIDRARPHLEGIEVANREADGDSDHEAERVRLRHPAGRIVNLGLEGIMLIGASTAFTASSLIGEPYVGLAAAVAGAAA